MNQCLGPKDGYGGNDWSQDGDSCRDNPQGEQKDSRGMVRPLKLSGNRVWRSYRGGLLLEGWLQGKAGEANGQDGHYPEEWAVSTVEARNPGKLALSGNCAAASRADTEPDRGADEVPEWPEGLSRVVREDGSQLLLREMIANHPVEMLGADQASRCEAGLSILVKILDSAERLAIQVHPDRETAGRLFNSAYGKTEAWHIVGGRIIDGQGPYVLAGFKPGITRTWWEELFRGQDVPGMVEGLHRFEVKPGQTILIPGGVPHAIGPGCLLLELQEPTDFTIRVERTTPGGMALPDFSCHQGAGFERMFDCFHYDGCSRKETEERLFLQPYLLKKQSGGTARQLIGNEHTPYFAMEEWAMEAGKSLEAETDGFSALLAMEGSGRLSWEDGAVSIRQGDVFFLPAALSRLEMAADGGGLCLIRCLPPK